MRKIFFIISVTLISTLSFPQTPQEALSHFLALPFNTHAHIGLLIKDLTTDSIIISYNTNTYLIPASIQKLLTTFCALYTFGPEKKFFTDLYYSGSIIDSTLHGNIIIKGQGDPTLGSQLFNDTNAINLFASDIQQLGIKNIFGKIIADASIFGPDIVPHKWTWEDLGNYYGAPASGLCIYDNAYKIIFNTKAPGTPAKIIAVYPSILELQLHSFVKSANIRSDQSYIIGAPFVLERIITGRLPAYRDSFVVRGALPDPALLIAQSLEQTLKKRNIYVTGEAQGIYDYYSIDYNTDTLHLISRHFSPSLLDIIQQTNEKSINLYAEILLKHLALYYQDTASTRDGIKALYHCLNHLNVDTTLFDLYDGSGLSRYNNLTVKGLASFMEQIYHTPFFDKFVSTLPVAGVNGTLKYFGSKTILKDRFYGKSGSMRHVRNYAGFLFSPDNHIILIIIMTNNFRCSQSQGKIAIEKVLNQILRK